jgi:hypothetical protein
MGLESWMMSKEHILSEIRRTAEQNGGVALGREKFAAETGVKHSEWLGKYWARWGDAVRDAGLAPNEMRAARTDDDLLGKLAEFVRSAGHFPVATEIRMKAREDVGFPWHNTFAKFGTKTELIARLEAFCRARGQDDVAAICANIPRSQVPDDPVPSSDSGELGYVYLVRHGTRSEYKIGRTNNALRREGELRTQLPEMLKPIHVIKTDDAAGVERYWHRRFAHKRKNGEWFELNTGDVRAFKRWRNIW